ncbi:outer membrane beta-barrel family protein [Salinimicrobium catena]|uniref:outer membrane beta-barrel family protein n=1 Tax=Salinimicrobium catena TaxID=390640 RepID=UPI002FE4708A
MKLYRNFLLGLASLISPFLWSQEGSLSGSLQDQEQETIPFATVAVMKLPDSTVVTGTTTEMDGTFKMDTPQKGEYLLRFSAIGFKATFTEPFRVSATDYKKNFGKVIMETAVTSLDEVMIKTWRPRVKVENGKMVMRVQGTAVAAGSTAYEMLSRAPGVSVNQNGDFSINGKQGVAVMIDGRMSYLSPAELQAMLDGMPAENIEEIEVINNPSAKYDAEGAAGILNIKLKKNTLTGFTASIYSGVEMRHQTLFNGGLNLGYKSGNWNSFANVNLSERGVYRDQHSIRTFPGTVENTMYEQTGLQERKDFIPTVQLGTDYEINENNSIGVMANIMYRDRRMDWNTNSTLGNPGEDYLTIAAENDLDQTYRNAQFNVHYTGKLDTLGTTISANVDFARLNTEDFSDFTNRYDYSQNEEQNTQFLNSQSFSDFDIYAANIDLVKPLSDRSSFEVGVKTSKVVSKSRLEFYELQEGSNVYDPERSDSFKYTEEIYAAYVNYSNRLSNTWNVQVGLRAEQTVGEGNSARLDKVGSRDYLEFFPNIMLEQNVSDNYKLNYSFSKRISRPNYSYFNPVAFYLDPYSYVVGNPDLRAEITTSYKVSQTFFKKFNLLLSYDHVKDFSAEVPSTNNETGETNFTTRNLDNSRSFTATLVAPVELASFWNTNNNLVLNQQYFDLTLNDQKVSNDNFFYLFQTNHQINLPWDISLELNGSFQGPVAYGVYNIDEQWWLDAGLKKAFLNDRLNVTVSATDVFEGKRMDINAAFLGNTIYINQYFDEKAISVNLRYRLSRSKSKAKARSTNLEELERAGG